MKKFYPILILLMSIVWSQASVAQDVELLVEVPVPSDQITRLDERSNYIVHNFWKRLNYKGAFSAVDRMDATMGQFFSITPFATADTVFMAINTLISGIEKADAKNILPLARLAEKWCGTDSAEYESEDLMLPFAQAVARSKKIKGPEKEYYAKMAQRMENSREGVAPADFTFIGPGGNTARFSDVTEPTVLLFFYDPEDFNSRLARTRLGNDFVVKTLVAHNLLKVVSLYPGEATQAWKDDIETLPEGWIIGANPNIGDYFTIKSYPQLYFLNEDRIITDKDFSVDAAIIYFNQFLKK